MMRWLVAFVFTQVIEVPLYLRVTNSFRVAFLASTFTHPVVWFVFPLLPLDYWPMVALAEIFAVVVEAWWLRLNHVPRALFWSLLVNATSATVGLGLRSCFGVP
jgi:hypothetical protein